VIEPFASASELARRIRVRETSAEEILDALLLRIERINPRLDAIVTLDVDRARARAREADLAIGRDERWGPLHGVPERLIAVAGAVSSVIGGFRAPPGCA
jgi:amidase